MQDQREDRMGRAVYFERAKKKKIRNNLNVYQMGKGRYITRDPHCGTGCSCKMS